MKPDLPEMVSLDSTPTGAVQVAKTGEVCTRSAETPAVRTDFDL